MPAPTGPEVARSAPLAPGTRLGPCEIQAATGAGGMGQVYHFVRNHPWWAPVRGEARYRSIVSKMGL